jgi:hypothetical protein
MAGDETRTQANAAPVRERREHILDVRRPRLLPARARGDRGLAERGAPAARRGPVRLRDHDRLPDLVRQRGQARLQVRQRRGGAVERVERHADEVDVRQRERALVLDVLPPRVLRAGSEDGQAEMGREADLRARVPAVGEVDQDLGHAARAAGVGGGVQQLRRRVVAVLGDLADRPQQPVVDLVSDLHRISH